MKYYNLLIIAGLLACEVKNPVNTMDRYFNLDSLLNAQVQLLAQKDARLHKHVLLDAESEKEESVPDTAEWKEEFRILREFSLNKPDYAGAYRVVRQPDSIAYILKEGEQAPVESMSLKYADKELKKIESVYFEDRSIYQHRRKMTLSFDDKKLSTFRIEGFQKMILKDTIRYSVFGEVIVDE